MDTVVVSVDREVRHSGMSDRGADGGGSGRCGGVAGLFLGARLRLLLISRAKSDDGGNVCPVTSMLWLRTASLTISKTALPWRPKKFGQLSRRRFVVGHRVGLQDLAEVISEPAKESLVRRLRAIQRQPNRAERHDPIRTVVRWIRQKLRRVSLGFVEMGRTTSQG